jgi:hypothetical protein
VEVKEILHLEDTDQPCELHDWTLNDWKERFMALLRERHGKGGVNVCAECIIRARNALGKELGKL